MDPCLDDPKTFPNHVADDVCPTRTWDGVFFSVTLMAHEKVLQLQRDCDLYSWKNTGLTMVVYTLRNMDTQNEGLEKV